MQPASAGVENQRRSGFSEAQLADIAARYPGCLENTTSSTQESEEQANQYRGLLPAVPGSSQGAARGGTTQGSDQ